MASAGWRSEQEQTRHKIIPGRGGARGSWRGRLVRRVSSVAVRRDSSVEEREVKFSLLTC
eukprot:scaffold7941_cov40-Cyclotella_meneghiniana.AAC.1